MHGMYGWDHGWYITGPAANVYAFLDQNNKNNCCFQIRCNTPLYFKGIARCSTLGLQKSPYFPHSSFLPLFLNFSSFSSSIFPHFLPQFFLIFFLNFSSFSFSIWSSWWAAAHLGWPWLCHCFTSSQLVMLLSI